MSLETASTINQLNPSNPSGADRLKEGDDHIRLIKQALRNTFPGITGALDPSITQAFLLSIAGQLVPRGAVVLFAGAAAPTGWWLCDGSTATLSDGTGTIVTPDLRGRVPVGADSVHALGALFGQYAKTVTSDPGGAHTPTGTMSAHTHSFAGGTLSTSTAKTGLTIDVTHKTETAGGGTGNTLITATPNDPGHLHTVAIPTVTGAADVTALAIDAVAAHSHAVTIDTAQPSMAVNYIIKV